MKYYIVDAFAEKLFEGNPAAVCILDNWLSDDLMQNIAIENNLSETAFAVKKVDSYQLRWFTPGGEIELCGHATLATAFVLANFYEKKSNFFKFTTLSGELTVKKSKDIYEMDFPSSNMNQYPLSEKIIEALGDIKPTETYLGNHLVFVFENELQVKTLAPDFEKLKTLQEGLAVFVTAKSDEFDFVARAFWPKLNVNEDPVCGSMFCLLTPYWAKKLNKDQLTARQVSKRGGTVYCENCDSRVKISGTATLYAICELQMDA